MKVLEILTAKHVVLFAVGGVGAVPLIGSPTFEGLVLGSALTAMSYAVLASPSWNANAPLVPARSGRSRFSANRPGKPRRTAPAAGPERRARSSRGAATGHCAECDRPGLRVRFETLLEDILRDDSDDCDLRDNVDEDALDSAYLETDLALCGTDAAFWAPRDSASGNTAAEAPLAGSLLAKSPVAADVVSDGAVADLAVGGSVSGSSLSADRPPGELVADSDEVPVPSRADSARPDSTGPDEVVRGHVADLRAAAEAPVAIGAARHPAESGETPPAGAGDDHAVDAGAVAGSAVADSNRPDADLPGDMAPGAAGGHLAGSEVAGSGPAGPAAATSGTPVAGAAAAEASEPEVAEPELAEPELAEPEVAEPELAEPEVAEPEGADSVVLHDTERAAADVTAAAGGMSDMTERSLPALVPEPAVVPAPVAAPVVATGGVFEPDEAFWDDARAGGTHRSKHRAAGVVAETKRSARERAVPRHAAPSVSFSARLALRSQRLVNWSQRLADEVDRLTQAASGTTTASEDLAERSAQKGPGGSLLRVHGPEVRAS